MGTWLAEVLTPSEPGSIMGRASTGRPDLSGWPRAGWNRFLTGGRKSCFYSPGHTCPTRYELNSYRIISHSPLLRGEIRKMQSCDHVFNCAGLSHCHAAHTTAHGRRGGRASCKVAEPGTRCRQPGFCPPDTLPVSTPKEGLGTPSPIRG